MLAISFTTVCCLCLFICVSVVDGRSFRAKRSDIEIECPTPPSPANGSVQCLVDSLGLEVLCSFNCQPGYGFQGTTETDILFVCDVKTGFTEDLVTPPCIAQCTFPCLNGGTCVAPNQCKCEKDWDGSQCEHLHQDVCANPPAGRFGTLDCVSVDNVGKVCVPHCIPNFVFESTPPEHYVCSQDGTWTPDVTKIPDCAQQLFPISTTPQPVTVSNKAVCSTWGTNHFRTFDNKVYNFEGDCSYTLVYAQNLFEITLVNDISCTSACSRQVHVSQGSDSISLHQSEHGPELTWNNQVLAVPGYKASTVFEQLGTYLTLRSSLGYTIKWDGKQAIYVQVSEDLKGKLLGLCGKYNGNPADDFTDQKANLLTAPGDFGISWKKSFLGEKTCADAQQTAGCSSQPSERQQFANNTCGVILSDPDFDPCREVFDPAAYEESCQSDCCDTGSDGCMCDSMEAYSRACMDKGVKLNWRKQGRCEISCSQGKVFKECGSSCVKDCSSVSAVCTDTTCIDGCFCPDGTVLNNGSCISPDQCTCDHDGHQYLQGDAISQQCNECTCNAGSWNCTHIVCDKTCSATGDPHYETFDGLRYNFMGNCSYYLMKDHNFSVITDNVQCGHGDASCTKSITIMMGGLTIKLDQNHQVFINGLEITALPYEVPGIKVTMVTSLFMQASLSNGVTVLWDGKTRAYIKVPSTFFGKTIGMCGTFDGNQENDFLTELGTIEKVPNAFGNYWKTDSFCGDMPLTEVVPPCDINPQKKAPAVELCANLKSNVFQACHPLEDVTPYYDDCIYDLCACTSNMKDCMCPNLGSYADTCAAKGVKINWRLEVKDCMLQCPIGQEYRVCARPCERTCRDIALNTDDLCDAKCVEGCSCPDGHSLDNHGQCVPVSSCQCIFDGHLFPAGFIALIDAEICVCRNGKFVCSKGVPNFNLTDVPETVCPKNTAYTKCASSCPLTCETMHSPPTCSSADCTAGCECLPGFVFEGANCVNESECPCYHAGKAYLEGETYTQNCNECTCKAQNWQCTTNDCPSVCSAYGESHYTTFDGRHYEFQGRCDYVFVQSAPEDPNRFVITTRNTQCGTSGVTCFKEMDFVVGNEGSDNFYRLQLIRGQSVVPEPGSPFTVKKVGHMVYVSTPFGVTLQWDKQTRVYVQLATDHINKVEGLCGNFNHDPNDDFQNKEGLVLGKPTDFGDSWKLQSNCAPPKEILDTCSNSTQRKTWAQLKCSVLDSDLFKPCHKLVDQAQYVHRCQYDACGCDLGGDCECLCTAIAAYAHECAVSGVPIHWRSNDLCPIQCEQSETYNPCISLCPKKTCENRLGFSQITKECENTKGLCFEGCDLRSCPPGQVYDSLNEPYTCIPETLCKTKCQINGKDYMEGVRVEDTAVCRADCEVCICRSGVLERISECPCQSVIYDTTTSGIGYTSSSTARYDQSRTPPVTANKVCDELLGLFSQNITANNQFSATSSQSQAYEANQARLFNTHSGPYNGGAWIPRQSDQSQYISVDLGTVQAITGVAIQGQPDVAHWITKFTVATSIDGVIFFYYMDRQDTVAMEFQGNYDTDTVVKAFFDRAVDAKVVRLYPVEWHDGIALRMDLLTCNGQATLPYVEYSTTLSTGVPSGSTITGVSSGSTITGVSSGSTITGVPSGSTITGVPSDSPITGVPSGSTITGVPSGSTITGVPSGSTITGVPSGSTITGVPSGSTITGVPSGSTITGVPSGSTITGVPSGSTITGVPSGSTITGVPSGSTITGVPGGSTITGVPSGSTITGVPSGSTITGVPSGSTITGVPSGSTITGVPSGSTITGGPTGSTITGVLEHSTPSTTSDLQGSSSTLEGQFETTSKSPRCLFWSPWVSKNVPDQDNGETEDFFQDPPVPNACSKDLVVGIECRVKQTKAMWDPADSLIECSQSDATFVCIPDTDHFCEDYEIRVQCDTCSLTTATQRSPPSASTGSYIGSASTTSDRTNPPSSPPPTSTRSNIGSASTTSGTATPQRSATTPQGSATTPLGSATTPLGSATTPLGSATTPLGSATTPLGSATTPQGWSATTPQGWSATTPLGSATTPQGSATTPQGSATTPQGSATTPQGSATTPQGSATTPQGSATTPQGSATTPQGSATTPQGSATTPQGSATTPQGSATTPQGSATTPLGSATTPQGSATTPLGSATTPQGSATTPQGSATTPQGWSATTPLGSATTPLGSATTPLGSATLPQGSATTPLGSATTPQGWSATTPQGSATTPQGSATTPQGSATTPQGSATTPQGSATTPQGSATTPQGSATTPQGSTTTEQGSTTTEQESTTTEQGSATTPLGATTTEQGSTTTEQGSTTTEQGSTTTPQGSATTPQGSTTTEQGSTTTEQESTTTEQGSATTPLGSTTTKQEFATTPQGSATTPQGSATTPQGSTTTEQGSTTTEQGSTTTEQGSTTTEQGSTTTEQGSTTTKQEFATTPQVPRCLFWSPWVSKNVPDQDNGETEDFFQDPPVPNACSKDLVVGIECRVKQTKAMWDPADSLIECSLSDATFVCIPDTDHFCEDYEIRVQCDTCSLTTKTQSSPPSAPTSTGSYIGSASTTSDKTNPPSSPPPTSTSTGSYIGSASTTSDRTNPPSSPPPTSTGSYIGSASTTSDRTNPPSSPTSTSTGSNVGSVSTSSRTNPPSSAPSQPSRSGQSSTTVSSVEPLESTSPTRSSIGSTSTPIPRCLFWSPWVSKNVPDQDNGETEDFFQDPPVPNACSKDLVVGIECRVKQTKAMWDPADSLIECSLSDATFVCIPDTDHFCEDYEIRVQCDTCSLTTATQRSPPSAPTSTGSYIGSASTTSDRTNPPSSPPPTSTGSYIGSASTTSDRTNPPSSPPPTSTGSYIGSASTTSDRTNPPSSPPPTSTSTSTGSYIGSASTTSDRTNPPSSPPSTSTGSNVGSASTSGRTNPPSSTPSQPSRSGQSSTTVSSVEPLESTSPTRSSIGSTSTPIPRCLFWSPWVSKNVPDQDNGETEDFFQDPPVPNACSKDLVVGIECRVKQTKAMWDPADSLIECSLSDATFVCIPDTDHFCEDYEIRVQCDTCSLTTATQRSPPSAPTSTGSYIGSASTTSDRTNPLSSPPPTSTGSYIGSASTTSDRTNPPSSPPPTSTGSYIGSASTTSDRTNPPSSPPSTSTGSNVGSASTSGRTNPPSSTPSQPSRSGQSSTTVSSVEPLESTSPTRSSIGSTSTPTPRCLFWSPWVSKNVPDQDNGETEDFFQDPPVPNACSKDLVVGIECRVKQTKAMWDPADSLIECSLSDATFVCIPDTDHFCEDYEIRVQCDTCSLTTTTQHSPPSAPTSTGSYIGSASTTSDRTNPPSSPPPTSTGSYIGSASTTSDRTNPPSSPPSTSTGSNVGSASMSSRTNPPSSTPSQPSWSGQSSTTVSSVEPLESTSPTRSSIGSASTTSDRTNPPSSPPSTSTGSNVGSASTSSRTNPPSSTPSQPSRSGQSSTTVSSVEPLESTSPTRSSIGSTSTPIPRCLFWSPWVSKNVPDQDNGETEDFFQDPPVPNACSKDLVVGIECRVKQTKAMWDPADSLIECSLSDATFVCIPDTDHFCEDYEIRVQCDTCSLTTTTQRSPPSAPTSSGSYIGSASTPRNGTDVASTKPAPTEPSEMSSPSTVSSSINSSPAQSSSIPSNTTPTTTRTNTTGQAAMCSSVWSDWINRNSPANSDGDSEAMTNVEKSSFCPGGEVTDIECVDSANGQDWSSLNEALCSVDDGLSCTNDPFEVNAPCRDYQIRYRCNCSAGHNSSPSPTTLRSSTSTPTSHMPSPSEPLTTPSPAPTTSHACVTGWSSWINRASPDSGSGDYESMTQEELSSFCPGGKVTDINCVDSLMDDDWSSLNEATCTVGEGLACTNEQIAGVQPCRDYKIRYMCNCSDTTLSSLVKRSVHLAAQKVVPNIPEARAENSKETRAENSTAAAHPGLCSTRLTFSDPSESIGYFQVKPPTGLVCRNMVPIPDLLECSELCPLSLVQGLNSPCKSCQPTSTSKHSVSLTCSDGSHFSWDYEMPVACSCGPCPDGI